MKELLTIKGFLAFVAVAFINAFVDLGHKIIIQNTLFKAYDGELQILLTAVVNGLILLPFVMLLTPAGYISDKYPKNRVMRYSAWAAVGITLAITACYYLGLFVPAFALTFVLALQSAIYGPAKYGFIKELVGTDNLTAGNSWVQAATMVAILSGIVVFSALFELRLEGAPAMNPQDSLLTVAPLGWLLVAGSVLELYLAYRLPQLRDTDRDSRFDWAGYRRGRMLRDNLGLLTDKKPIILSVLGLALFWSISQVMLAVFPAFAEEHMDQHNTFVIQSVMALSGIGIMIGSALASRWSRHYINLSLIPVGAVGVALGLILLPQLRSMPLQAGAFLLIGISGALAVIPLNALVQFNAGKAELGRILAGYNFTEKSAMLLALGLTVFCAYMGVDGLWLLWLLALFGVLGAVAAIVLLPQAMIRRMFALLLNRKYRLEVLGFENMPAEGQGVLLLGNHISWLDWAIVQLACPRHVTFVMERAIYERWYLKWFLDLYGVIPISSGNSRSAMQQINQRLNRGEVVCLFPEGAISHNGQLASFKRGFEWACEGADGVIVPFYLRGLWGSRFSRSTERLRSLRSRGLKRDLIVAFGEPMAIDSSAAQVKARVHELSISAWQQHTDSLEPLAHAFVRSARYGMSDMAIADVQGEPLSRRKLLTACTLFSRRLARVKAPNLGLLMPTSSAGSIANMAALMAGKTVVNLNFTASQQALLAALEQAEVDTIVTAHKFVKKLKGRGIDLDPLFEGRTILYMEDIKAHIGKAEALGTLAMVSLLPTWLLQRLLCARRQLDDTAAIMFSSGSEGAPKGVMLSHRNIMANLRQVSDVLNVQEQECMMATLPLFHAFGLTVTGLLPLIEGIPVVCHPDPTDAVNIAKGVARYKATFMCATSTFLRLYTRNSKVHPLMFKSLRVVVAGAEKLDDQVRAAFEGKFHVPIVEGYGCTETTPVASVNLPDELDTQWWTVQVGSKPGTVGMPLPGSTFRIVDPDTLEQLPVGEDGLILIGGSQIMKGYLNAPQKTADAVVELDGIRWYKSGDKGHLDEDGFLTIVDRYSRFAKLGGEMVSLSAVEQGVRSCLQAPELPLVAVNLPDAKKGEKLVLLLEGEHEPTVVRQQLVQNGLAPLMVPAAIYPVPQVPVLGSGKTDYRSSRELAEALCAGAC
ncbi:acyl-[ACP]--phospholipid O-acyltransferase [Marinobacterium arenosum]|uniref:acyl-[ACP]--phospholipid O-acyltransferase n=1 Tax=Marinobacterium arenosum TaxID=2862496 RepID=UPI001C97DBBA|nr:acyl-[ACP]--phospholipid O-acyltransferase [Marinobacterium arenosum]MBY4678448.1 acyl-[ACP]--phospholipid O-acyltransferase [Marinobacterium arenosum]